MSEAIVVKPVSGAHAIEVMALAVEWSAPLSREVLLKAQALHDAVPAIRDFVPRKEQLRGVRVQIGDSGTSVATTEHEGAQWSRHRADGQVTWAVNVGPEFLACNCMEYGRWLTVKPKALDLLMPVVELVRAEGVQVQAVGLQYQDAFRVYGGRPREMSTALFATESRWLTPHVFEVDGPWHVHQGWFSSSKAGRLMHNAVNIDAIAEPDCMLYRINGQHRLLAKGSANSDHHPIEVTDISQSLEDLHHQNKKVLWELLSGQVSAQIGLTITSDHE